jgi:hypothetical protein
MVATCSDITIIMGRKTTDNPVFSSVTIPQTFPFPRNEDVVFREAIFLELNRLLSPTSNYQSAVLWGLGGSGYESTSMPQYLANR